MLRYSVDRSSVDMVGGGWGPGAAGWAAVQGLVDEQVALNTVQLLALRALVDLLVNVLFEESATAVTPGLVGRYLGRINLLIDR